jgi:hypothetical protein
MIDTDRPDLSGGIRFVASPRHHGYVDSHAFRRYLSKVTRQIGWPELKPGMFAQVAA